MKFVAFVLIFNSLFVFVEGFGLNFWKLRSTIRNNRLQRQYQSSPDAASPLNDVALINQPLDHFDPQIKTTFAQRYWVNDQYWSRPNGPVFIYIGGEGPLGASSVISGAHIKYAEKHKALLFGVEHRFYGESFNDDGMKLENLRFLSSQQALADLANFHLKMSKSYNLTKQNKWISFGGSYPGSLSAWFRIKYPHLVHASVASSAPVRALVNFDGYCDVVAKSLATEIVGGSKKCLDTVRSAFNAVDKLIQKRNLTQLAKDFVSCHPLEEDLDVLLFVSNLADSFMETVQYNNEMPLGFNIKSVCEMMTQGLDAYQNLVALNKKFLDTSGQNCSDNSWQNFIRIMSNLNRTENAMRPWTYQTCSQFGYYQTCDDADCPFSRYMTLPSNFKLCETVFNLKSNEVYDRIDFTNEYYGTDDPKGSRILFVNGLIDPWHALSVLNNISQSELAIVIPGTAHCADMHNDTPEDPPALTEARKQISSRIGEWLSEKNNAGAKISRKKLSQLKRKENSLRSFVQKL